MLVNKELMESAERILMLKDFIIALQKKLVFLRIEYAMLDEAKRNEIAIEEFKVFDEIRIAQKKLVYMDRIFNTQLLSPYLDDIRKVSNFVHLITKWQKSKFDEKQFEMKNLLDNVKWDNFSGMTFWERVEFYREIKDLIQKQYE